LNQAEKGKYQSCFLRGADAATVAEKLLEKDKQNDDLMMVVADNSLKTKDYDKAAKVALQMVEALKKKPAPEGTDAATWEKTKTAKMARGYFMAGSASYEQKKWSDADTYLRAGLPLMQGNNELLAPTYFYLGFANHELSRTVKATSRAAVLADAKKFTAACAAIAGPLQTPCRKNLEGLQAGR